MISTLVVDVISTSALPKIDVCVVLAKALPTDITAPFKSADATPFNISAFVAVRFTSVVEPRFHKPVECNVNVVDEPNDVALVVSTLKSLKFNIV